MEYVLHIATDNTKVVQWKPINRMGFYVNRLKNIYLHVEKSFIRKQLADCLNILPKKKNLSISEINKKGFLKLKFGSHIEWRRKKASLTHFHLLKTPYPPIPMTNDQKPLTSSSPPNLKLHYLHPWDQLTINIKPPEYC